MSEEVIKKVHCKICNFSWWPKTPKKPGVCTRCKSPRWDIGPVRQPKDKVAA